MIGYNIYLCQASFTFIILILCVDRSVISYPDMQLISSLRTWHATNLFLFRSNSEDIKSGVCQGTIFWKQERCRGCGSLFKCFKIRLTSFVCSARPNRLIDFDVGIQSCIIPQWSSTKECRFQVNYRIEVLDHILVMIIFLSFESGVSVKLLPSCKVLQSRFQKCQYLANF